MINLKELSQKKEKFVGGHHLCPGCGAPIIIRQSLLALSEYPIVSISATGCVEVSTTLIPNSSWKIPWFHSAFENAAASASGIWHSYLSQKKLPKNLQIVVFAGDGGTYDIGLQSLSGACERKDNFIYICYNNEAYMNTGVQKSSASPLGAYTATTPKGIKNNPKDLSKIMVAHNLEYVAQASVGYPIDLMSKIKKASRFNGVKFINVLSPCVLGWKYDSSQTVKIGKLAVESGFWPIYEVEKGKYKINQQKPNKKVIEFLKSQKRFENLFKPSENHQELEKYQKIIDNNWDELEGLSKLNA